MYGRRELIGVTIDVDVQKWKDVVLFFFVREIDVASCDEKYCARRVMCSFERSRTKMSSTYRA